MRPDWEHPTRTRHHGYRYLFTAKHRGGGSSRDACWAPGLSDDEEFGVFDLADEHEISDGTGNLYGVLRGPDGTLRELGTCWQVVAKFWLTGENLPWHGHPLWPINPDAALASRKADPPREALERLAQAGLLTKAQKKRLAKGAHL